MKRSPGVTLFGVLFLLWFLRGLGNFASIKNQDLAPRLFLTGFLFLTLAVGIGLLRRTPWSMRAYWTWAGLAIAYGGLTEYYVAGEPLVAVLALVAFVAAFWIAIGWYLRGRLRPHSPQA